MPVAAICPTTALRRFAAGRGTASGGESRQQAEEPKAAPWYPKEAWHPAYGDGGAPPSLRGGRNVAGSESMNNAGIGLLG
ncbi:hypothetical protein E2562_034902 [Oryza meyeriana var. granulata]|uniref:Uncharacterized protein n=1 Tax=Oryza meyeriana var. granulata TaxID=110450 RepID=A0A6G1E6L5_9ORYZ|nr:hypothetical protein E2562_034902 [Oryza meyeriana var. granulata]